MAKLAGEGTLNESEEPTPADAELSGIDPDEVQSSGSRADLHDGWGELVSGGTDTAIAQRFTEDLTAIMSRYFNLDETCCLFLFEPDNSIDSTDLDQIYSGLKAESPAGEKDVFLLLLSQGGDIENAYQISKLCKSHARSRFTVGIPRQAKSAATLIALGADEIHMGELGQLGPIDPQIGGLPALGVTQALQSLAGLAAKFPAASEMLAKYLESALTVEQIGYNDRICESAVQYAERLLLTKKSLPEGAATVANRLVYEYKHHGFVIDYGEAQSLLGGHWVKTGTPEVLAAESVYTHFRFVSFLLNVLKNKRLLYIGRRLSVSATILSRKKH